MQKKIFAVATFAFAMAFAVTASAVSATAIYTPSTGYLQMGSGMGAKAYQAPNVVAAQTALDACVPGMALVKDGKMGPLTTGKFKSFQASKGLVQDGIIGPLTAAQLAACSGSTPSTPSTPSSLEGTDGTISDVNELSQYNNEEVGEGESDVKIAGFEVEASNDGDIELVSVKVSFDPAGNNSSDSDHLDDYIDGVKIWMGNDEVGSADVDEFSEDDNNIYTKTISLDDSVIRADDMEKFYVTVDAAGNLDSGDIDSDSWTFDVESIRFKDGSGVVTTETGYDVDGMDVPMDFVDFGTAADTELKVKLDSDSPEEGIVSVDDTDNTDDVVLLKGTLELDGTSDVTIDELPITLVSTGDSISALASSIKLVLDGEEYTESTGANCSGSCDSNTTASLTFDNLNFDLSAGDSVDFEILADINDTNNSGVTATDFDEGDTLLAKVTSDNRVMIDAENEEGDQLSDSEKSGTATGKAQEFRTSTATFTLVSTNTAVGTATSNNTGTFTIRFKVAAGDDAVYLSSVIGNAVTYAVDRAGTTTTGGVSAAFVNITDSSVDNGVGLYEVNPGSPETFELTVTATVPTSGQAGLYRAAITGILWGTDSTDNTPNNTYSANISDYRTSYISIN